MRTISPNAAFSGAAMTTDYTEEIYRKWESIKTELKSIVEQYQELSEETPNDDQEYVDLDFEKEKTDIESKIQVLNAIIRIAAAHTTKRAAHSDQFPYDKEKLSIIQVQIDPHSSDDPAAAELFREAYGQQNYLKKRYEDINAAAEKKAQERSRQKVNKDEHKRRDLDGLLSLYSNILSSNQFLEILNSCNIEKVKEYVEANQCVFAGYQEEQIPVPLVDCDKFKRAIRQNESSILNHELCTVRLPLIINLEEGASVAVGFLSNNKNETFNVIRNILLQSLLKLHSSRALENVAYIDPVTFSPLPLDNLAILTSGTFPIINEVPKSPEDLRLFFDALRRRFDELDKKYLTDKSNSLVSDIFVVRAFPAAYDLSAISIIRKLIVMARTYKILVLLEIAPTTHMSTSCEDAVTEILNKSICYGDKRLFEECFAKEITQGIPNYLYNISEEQDLIDYLFSLSQNELSLDNRYFVQIQNQTQLEPIKGDRRIDNIPIGLTEKGELIHISLENENFATFICGASRSGKSTLLHTFLSGVFLTKHPDDVEVWLVDFKMTEFSRYAQFTPPHVRYVVLDESPEIVYDLLDRLFEVLSKRQAIFKKNGWTKLSDAQDAGRYMPALLVVVDEFSIMSKIVSDSALAGKDYKDKLQILLSKGAALGFRFVFSSQGFTQGTRGLSDYSKRQIQQRIAMKTEYGEIRETLDMPHASDAERYMMENLAPHYALIRTQTNTGDSNRLQKAHVLFFEEIDEQIQYLKKNCSKYKVGGTYEQSSPYTYINKQAQVFDGNELVDFSSVRELITNRIFQLKTSAYDKSTFYICLGQPVRMRTVFPVEITSGYSENILFIAPPSRGKAFQSAVATMASVLDSQRVQLKLIVLGNSPLLPSDFIPLLSKVRLYYGVDGFRKFISETESEIANYATCKTENLTIVLGLDTLLGNSRPYGTSRNRQNKSDDGIVFEPRKAGEVDLISQIRSGSIEAKVEFGQPFAFKENEEKSPNGALSKAVASLRFNNGTKEETNEKDLDNSLKDLLEDGPRYGTHFMVVVSDIRELKKCGISSDSFKHKVAFRMPQEDARSIASRVDAIAIAELPENNYRYTNGIDGVTMRPYAHFDKDLFSIDIDIDQEYLL